MDDPLPVGLVAEWERFFYEDFPKMKMLEAIHTPVFDSPILFPLQRKAELKKMLDYCYINAWSNPLVMEIGADKGGGFYHLCHWLQPTAAIAIEIRGVPYANAFINTFPKTDMLFLEGSSYGVEIVQTVNQFLAGRKLDVLFIDGDKSMFYRDFEIYLEHVRPGGIILMHDITDDAPGRAFADATTHPRTTYCSTIVDKSDYEAERGREALGEPARNPYEGWLRHWKGKSCGVGILRV
jgi:cephalosporin hydroxylase